jgi:hypothetical protein
LFRLLQSWLLFADPAGPNCRRFVEHGWHRHADCVENLCCPARRALRNLWYGSARASAEHKRRDGIVALLQETLDEEWAADEELTSLSEGEILPAADAVEEAVGS